MLILLGKFLIDAIPGIGPDISWTFVNCTYMAVRLQTVFTLSILHQIHDLAYSVPHLLIPFLLLPPFAFIRQRCRQR
jgi:hypothetical protein